MPFTTGTALSPSDLMNQINTFITANGWVRLRGETDQVPASPKAARYWRILMVEQETVNDDFFELEEVELRETLGGPSLTTASSNWSASSENGANVVGNLLPGTAIWQSADIENTGTAWVKYDFGSPQVIRQMSIKCNIDGRAPTQFHLQWSNDNLSWCTMYQEFVGSLSWLDNETKIFSFDDGYVDPEHASSLIKRTAGLASQQVGYGTRSDDWFIWQGPGYDASRRVFIGMASNYDLPNATHHLELRAFTSWSGNSINQIDEEGADTTNTPKLVFSSDGIDFWLYVSSIRVVLVVKNSVTDYTSCYLGFGSAFAQPDDWGFPLIVAGTSDGFDTIFDIGNEQSMFCDPGSGAMRIRLWDNNWQSVINRPDSNLSDLIGTGSQFSVHPWSPGSGTGDGNFPYAQWGDNDSGGSHILSSLDPTEQGDLPVMSAIVQSAVYGNLMALEGVFAIPGGGLVAAEQILNIGGQNYRVFPNRTRRAGNNFFLIRED